MGRSVPRREGLDKARGTARYVDDLRFPGMLHGRTIRTTIPAGEVTAVHLDFDRAGFTLVDHHDVPGRNVVALIQDDQPFLVEREVRHTEEPVLLLAHEDRDTLGAATVRLDYRPSEPVLDPERSTHVFKEVVIAKGDLARGFAEADLVVEGEYRTGRQEHVYVEPQGVIAVPATDGVTVYGSLQCPYYVHKALVALLGLPPGKVRVVQTETGGGFGGKEDYPSIIAGHAALAGAEVGPAGEARLRPPRGHGGHHQAPPLDRPPPHRRHPRRADHRHGDRRPLRRRGLLHAEPGRPLPRLPPRDRPLRLRQRPRPRPGRDDEHAPLRSVPRVRRAADRLRGRGAHGPGGGGALPRPRAPAREERPAARRHAWPPARCWARTRAPSPSCARPSRAPSYHRKRRAFRGTNRGIGLSLFFHGAGFTGSGEVMLASRASLELTARGARILVGSTEMGQGARTTLAQIVAEELGWPSSASRSRTPTPRASPTAARPSPPAPAWSWAAS